MRGLRRGSSSDAGYPIAERHSGHPPFRSDEAGAKSRRHTNEHTLPTGNIGSTLHPERDHDRGNAAFIKRDDHGGNRARFEQDLHGDARPDTGTISESRTHV